jgi:CRP-like cAMP-binding protein/GNAT superfamily N-acetyltransferase
MAIEIREAIDPMMRERVFRFRYDVHVRELGKGGPGVDHEAGTIIDPGDEGAALFFAEEEGRIVGCGRTNFGVEGPIPENYRAWFKTGPAETHLGTERVSVTSRLMVDPTYRGRTLASLLVMNMYQRAVEHGVITDFIMCEPNLLRLYYRLGYRQHLPPIRPVGPGMRVPLVLTVQDWQHLIRVESPFAMLLAPQDDDAGEMAEQLTRMYPDFDANAPCLKGDLRTVWAHLADGLTRSRRPTLMRGLSEAQVDRVLGSAAGLAVATGEVIRHREERRPGLGVLLEGRMGVGLPTGDGWHWLEILGPGDVFGEPEAINEGRATDLVALEDSRAALLSENLLERTTRKDPELAILLQRNLVGILRQRVDDLHRRGAAWVLQTRERLVREQTIPPISGL